MPTAKHQRNGQDFLKCSYGKKGTYAQKTSNTASKMVTMASKRDVGSHNYGTASALKA